MTTVATTSTNLTPASPLKLSQRVRTQLTAANARIDEETAKLRGALTAVAKRVRALFPVPSRSDIAELSARLERLEKEIDRLAGARAAGATAAAATPPVVAEKRVRKAKTPKA
jgi:small-conductance mechanosensitive channel